MTSGLTVDLFVEESGKKTPFPIHVSEPIRTEGEDDYYCIVGAPALLSAEKRIFGADGEQAYELAIQFLTTMIGNRRLVDKAGNVVSLPSCLL